VFEGDIAIVCDDALEATALGATALCTISNACDHIEAMVLLVSCGVCMYHLIELIVCFVSLK
jgi:hypothetical protein